MERHGPPHAGILDGHVAIEIRRGEGSRRRREDYRDIGDMRLPQADYKPISAVGLNKMDGWLADFGPNEGDALCWPGSRGGTGLAYVGLVGLAFTPPPLGSALH